MANPNANSLLTNEPGCIAGGLPLKTMRIAMENKGIFDDAKPGALYYFTGEYNTVKIDDVTYKIQLTVNNGKILGAKLVLG